MIAFEGHAFMALRDDELKLACVRTYNDYQREFASVAPDRFVTLAVLPFWDLEASVEELRRCHGMGHRGVLWAATLDKHGLPDFTDPHWDPRLRRGRGAGHVDQLPRRRRQHRQRRSSRP